ncbi:Gfo/Idh/MocA family oxidoreductase [Leucobacter sp. CSA1]|uniref:Gfo/Idh/MocA family oxidoreductase n=2 Tax=Leucobacter chromiisoli TaxID=2796471 RepID=A0A934Q8C4_9MICO|nr:Gfo/Idh/MocA family oxidoreductase [Leucobacter chromiisoli]
MGREIATAIQRWPALIDHPCAPRVTAVCDINPAAMEWFEQLGTVELFTTDFEELLASEQVDVVYIAVRHDLHEAMYTAAIAAGKDLLAEKPFGIDLAAARRIVQSIEEHPESFVRCSSEMPFFPGAQMAIDIVRSGGIGRVIEAENSFWHSSDFDLEKPINWKRQARFCGEAGVMNDLGLHALHVPLRLGWDPDRLFAVLQDLVPERPDGQGGTAVCDTFENAQLHGIVETEEGGFPLSVSMKRIAPGEKNTWTFRAIGLEGGVEFSTKNPKQVRVLTSYTLPGGGVEQAWSAIEAGSQSVWPTVTGGIFESGFSDSILQMWAAFLAERAGQLGDRFGCVRPEEALRTHEIYASAIRSHEERSVVSV